MANNVGQIFISFAFNWGQFDALIVGQVVFDCEPLQVEPDEQIKGVVARASLFMSDFYQLQFSDAQRKLFVVWDRLYPPNTWEKQWAQRVAEKEGYKNPYVEKYA